MAAAGCVSQETLALEVAQEDRITDAYVKEAMDLEHYKLEMDRLKAQRQELENSNLEIDRLARHETDSRKSLSHLESFCRQVATGLESMEFDEKQQLLRLLVDRITVENGGVKIEAVIPAGPGDDKLRSRCGEPVEPYERDAVQESTHALRHAQDERTKGQSSDNQRALGLLLFCHVLP